MKKLVNEEEGDKKDTEIGQAANNSSSSPIAGSSSQTNNIQLPSTPSGSSSDSNQSSSGEIQVAEMQFEEASTQNEGSTVNELRQSSITDAINIPIVTSSTS